MKLNIIKSFLILSKLQQKQSCNLLPHTRSNYLEWRWPPLVIYFETVDINAIHVYSAQALQYNGVVYWFT